MEEMNKEIVDNTVTEIVEETTKKLTFGENCLAYTLTGIFAVGVVTTGYLGYKGIKAAVKKIKNKKEIEEETDDNVVDVDHVEIHEVKDNDEQE
jgi:predicted DNA-binding transcriptional regulator